MSAFDKREEGFEKAFALSEEMRFKALARRNKYLGLWAAEQLGMANKPAQDFAREFWESLIGETDDEALRRRLGDALPDISAHRIQRKIDEMMARATREIVDGR